MRHGRRTAVPEIVDGVRQQFQEQVDFFRGKLSLPSENWRSIERSAHDRGFIVAGVMKADLLADLRSAVDEAVRGGSIGEFRDSFRDIVAKHGWTGWTGEGTERGQAWRTRVIYQTNVATSYAAGRRAQLKDPALLARRPFWRYVHNDGVAHPRPLHKLWGDQRLTLRHDHPFWDTHFPPNGWGCMCRVVAVPAPASGDATEPPEGWADVDPKTGAPAGIDEGWDYAPGASADADLRSFVQEKLVSYPPAIARILRADVRKGLEVETRAPDYARQALDDRRQRMDDLWLGFPTDAGAVRQAVGFDVGNYLLLMPADAVRHVDTEHAFDGGDQRPPRPEDYSHVGELLTAPYAARLSATTGQQGQQRVVITKEIGGERFEAVFEVRPGKWSRALTLISLWIKTS